MTIKIDPVKFEIMVTLTHKEAEHHNVYTIVDEILCAIERNDCKRELIGKDFEKMWEGQQYDNQ